ncbi:hypothetical protein GW17_00051212 [Ensete ventricosum]|nr:hypothetical protein GW17_00051212 [Ensete ventricosum]
MIENSLGVRQEFAEGIGSLLGWRKGELASCRFNHDDEKELQIRHGPKIKLRHRAKVRTIRWELVESSRTSPKVLGRSLGTRRGSPKEDRETRHRECRRRLIMDNNVNKVFDEMLMFVHVLRFVYILCTSRSGLAVGLAALVWFIQEVVPPKVLESIICDFPNFLAVVSPPTCSSTTFLRWWSQNPGLYLVVVPPVLVVVSPIP